MHSRTNHDVQMPLSRLPARDWQRIRSRNVAAASGISINTRTMTLPFHAEHQAGSRITGGEFEGGDSPWVGVLAGSLDDPSWFQPQMDIFVSDAQPWDQMDPAIPKFGQYPPAPTKE